MAAAASTRSIPPYLSLSQVGRLLRVSFRRVQAMRDQGQLPQPVRMGKHDRFPTTALFQRYPEAKLLVGELKDCRGKVYSLPAGVNATAGFGL